jgi:hypothetical protein
MKYSAEYCGSGLLYAGCTQEYVLNLLPLYRLIFPHETVNILKRTVLSYSCELTWQSSRVVCSFVFIQKLFPSACPSHFPQPQTISNIPAKYSHILNTLTNVTGLF